MVWYSSQIILTIKFVLMLWSCGREPSIQEKFLIMETNSVNLDYSYIKIETDAHLLTNRNPIEFTPKSAIYDEFIYKVIGGDNDCGQDGYSNWLPMATLVTKKFERDGTYKICVLGRNKEGKVLKIDYVSTKVLTLDTQAPVAFLTNTPSTYSNSSILEVSIDDEDTVDYQFKLVDQLYNSCSGGGYNGIWIPVSIPISDEIDLDGDYRLCVIGRDHAKNVQKYATEHNWFRDTKVPTVTLSILPGNPSNENSINVSVMGQDVVAYQYKLITQEANCADSGYDGDWISKEEPIIEALSMDSSYRLCVIGQDAAGNIQSEDDATEHIWTKASTDILVLTQ